ncbi:MAG: MBL fold metallo-hydrolase [Alphaproteobacteria bacterium]
MALVVEPFFDERASAFSYLVADRRARRAAIIDPVLGYEPRSGRTSTALADRMIARVGELGVELEWMLETHPHADHLSAAGYLKDRLGGRMAIGEHVVAVERTWKEIYNLGADFRADGSQFDHLFRDGERFAIGGHEAQVLHTPGHTPACVSYAVDGRAWIGDTMFMPDDGTARADFPGGDAATLYRSIRRILALPPETRLFVCHDYRPGGRPLAFETSVAAQRAGNTHVRDGVSEAEFVAMRRARDKTLILPEHLLAAIQINIRGGRLPPAEPNGTSYLKIPLNRF